MNDELQLEFLDSKALAQLTGTPASTWRYWAITGLGPPSFKLGRRRVWKRADVMAWLAARAAEAVNHS